jgi:hypothetical protein
MKCAIEMASCGMICVPSFMKIGGSVQVILRFCHGNLRYYNDDITGGRNL